MKKPNACLLLEVDDGLFSGASLLPYPVGSEPSSSLFVRTFSAEAQTPKGGRCIIVIVKVFNDVLAYRTPNDARCLFLAFGVALLKRECPALRMIVPTTNKGSPRRWCVKAEDDAHRSGLPCTIRAEKPSDVSRLDSEAQTIHRSDSPEALGELLDLDHRCFPPTR